MDIVTSLLCYLLALAFSHSGFMTIFVFSFFSFISSRFSRLFISFFFILHPSSPISHPSSLISHSFLVKTPPSHLSYHLTSINQPTKPSKTYSSHLLIEFPNQIQQDSTKPSIEKISTLVLVSQLPALILSSQLPAPSSQLHSLLRSTRSTRSISPIFPISIIRKTFISIHSIPPPPLPHSSFPPPFPLPLPLPLPPFPTTHYIHTNTDQTTP